MNAHLDPKTLKAARRGPTRREAVTTMLSAAGGLAVGVTLPADAFAAEAKGPLPMGLLQSPEVVPAHELSAFVVIDPDNTVTVRLPHNELGQGTTTALAMLIAEELHCDWSKVKCEYGSANRNIREKAANGRGGVYGSMQTVGSQGVRTSVGMMQQAGASARVRLIEAAARQWKCDASECKVQDSVIQHMPTGRKLTYGAVCAQAVAVKLDAEPKIKPPEEYTIVGKPTPRLDTRPKLDGSAMYGIDARVPGTGHWRIEA